LRPIQRLTRTIRNPRPINAARIPRTKGKLSVRIEPTSPVKVVKIDPTSVAFIEFFSFRYSTFKLGLLYAFRPIQRIVLRIRKPSPIKAASTPSTTGNWLTKNALIPVMNPVNPPLVMVLAAVPDEKSGVMVM